MTLTAEPKLKPREAQVIRAAVHAWSLVENGNYLCATSEEMAAERLIERGYLTKVTRLQPAGFLVVVLTPENVAALRAAGYS